MPEATHPSKKAKKAVQLYAFRSYSSNNTPCADFG
jgi:hypothetical protein